MVLLDAFQWCHFVGVRAAQDSPTPPMLLAVLYPNLVLVGWLGELDTPDGTPYTTKTPCGSRVQWTHLFC